MDKNGLIYLCVNSINNKCYVGKTTTTLNRRMSDHVRKSKNVDSTSLFHKAIRKYGWSKFTVSVVAENIPEHYLDESEKYYIKYYHSHFSMHGYNLTWGGDGGSMPLESIQRGIDTKRKRGNLKHSIETRNQISETMTGISKTIEHRENISKARLGMKFTDITKKKMSDSKLGNIPWNKNKKGLTKGINSKPVLINGITYQSAIEASEVLNISIHTVRYRIKSTTFTEWKKYG